MIDDILLGLILNYLEDMSQRGDEEATNLLAAYQQGLP